LPSLRQVVPRHTHLPHCNHERAVHDTANPREGRFCPASGRPRVWERDERSLVMNSPTRRFWLSTVAAVGFAALAAPAQLSAQNTVAIDNDDIGGVVTGANGPEAGVWVIAETRDLPTRYAKMVVTDDQGRYLVPDLPKGKYKVWVRGYGLVDSAKVDAEPGQQLNLRATPAPNDAAAAAYYPAIYWYSMLKIPEANHFGTRGGQIPQNVKQIDYINLMKNNGCVGCHQLGTLSTRTIPAFFGN